MRNSVTSAINDVHNNTVSTFGDPRLHREYGFPLVPAVQLSAAYSFDSPESLVECHEDKYRGLRYCRDGNARDLQLEAYFEAMFPGCRALMYNSGMSAMAAAMDLHLPVGGTVFMTTETYRKTYAYLERQSKRLGFRIARFQRAEELVPELEKGEPALIVLETPTNPHLYLHDFEAIADLRDRFGCPVVADISMAGVCNIQFDFSRYDCTTISCTKYISGHNDLLGGVVVAGSEAEYQELWNLRSERGGLMEPLSAYLLLRSLRTYDMRVARQVANAERIIAHLDNKPHINSLCHPLRATGEQAEIFGKYYEHGGSLISFVADMDVDTILGRLTQMHSVKMAPSFGAIDTLMEVPAVMSHYGRTPEELRAMGLEPNLVRLSVGCEPMDDLIRDLDFLFEGKKA